MSILLLDLGVLIVDRHMDSLTVEQLYESKVANFYELGYQVAAGQPIKKSQTG